MENLKNTLIEFIAAKHSWWSRLLVSGKFDNLYKAILNDDRFKKYPDFKFTLHTMCYWITHDLYDFPVCSNVECRKLLMKNINYKSGYNSHCCVRCASLDKTV